MTTAVSQEDFKRLEAKVDKLTDAVSKLILFEERQATQGERIGKCETKLAVVEQSVSRVDTKVERWVNRGIGVWALAVAMFALVQFASKFVGA